MPFTEIAIVWSEWERCKCSNGNGVQQRTCISNCYSDNLLTETRQCQLKSCITESTTSKPVTLSKLHPTTTYTTSSVSDAFSTTTSSHSSPEKNSRKNSSYKQNTTSEHNTIMLKQDCTPSIIIAVSITTFIVALFTMFMTWIVKVQNSRKTTSTNTNTANLWIDT